MKDRKTKKTLYFGAAVLIVGMLCMQTAVVCEQTENNNNSKDLVGMTPNWYELFDTYTDGQFLDGTSDDGGWEGWAGTPEAGAYVTSEYYRSAPHSVDIVGAVDLIHQFEGYTEGVWNFTAWIYIPDDMEGTTYYIVMSDYADGDGHWNIQMAMDSFTLEVEAQWDGYTLPLITGQWVELLAIIDLDQDWYEFYYDGELLEYKPWSDGVNNDGEGSLNIACLDLYANGATSVYYDDISIVAYGTVAAPDLKLGGSLGWTDVGAGETVTGEFTVSNGGTPGTQLDWEIESWPEWGDWTFTPTGGDDLTGVTTVQVSVVAPDEANQEFTGNVKVVNKENSEDFETISVSLVTPRNKAIHPLFQQFLEQHPNIFPVLRHLLGL
jgi:hypothetical protein